MLLKPSALCHGDVISVIVPASPVDRERIDRGLQRLASRGYRIKTYRDIYRANGYLAGDDQTRAGELMASFADPESTAVWCARGGYGVVRLLDQLDFNVIRDHPKVFVGFSDITALHIAMQKQAGLITFHGPNVQDGFGNSDDMPVANEAALWQTIATPQKPTTLTGQEFDFADSTHPPMQTIAPGAASGRLVGGNLAVLAGLMGTPYEIETSGRILFLEDISERAYRIDRYLAQLKLAGKLQSAAGILLGTFSYEGNEASDPEDELRQLFREYLGDLKIPVVANFPAGHTSCNLTLALGAQYELDATNHTLILLENPVLA